MPEFDFERLFTDQSQPDPQIGLRARPECFEGPNPMGNHPPAQLPLCYRCSNRQDMGICAKHCLKTRSLRQLATFVESANQHVCLRKRLLGKFRHKEIRSGWPSLGPFDRMGSETDSCLWNLLVKTG